MNIQKLSYLVLSDIHLGHKKVSTEFIIKNLDKFFKKYYNKIKKVKYIFIAGDVYDRLLNHSNKEVNLITAWLINLVHFCIKHNIKLRVLKGTPSHDWDQLSNLDTIIKESKLEVDFKYIDDIYIEEDLEYGINILYIPDEIRHTADEVLEAVKSIMKKKQLDKVDLVIMHGQFHYQLPGIELDSSHTESEYLNIAKYLIHPGHIHKHSIFERIVAQGSFDRLAHNEEEDKGAILAEINKDGTYSYEFLKNKDAKIFKTIKIDETDIDKFINKLKKEIVKYPEDSFIALDIKSDNPIKNNLKDIKKDLPKYNITLKKQKQDKTNDKILEERIETENIIAITEDNIEELIIKKIEDLSSEELVILIEELNKIK